jgi:hypothetical protein
LNRRKVIKWEKERHIKKNSTFCISVDEDINIPMWEVRVDSLRKDIYLAKTKEVLCTC